MDETLGATAAEVFVLGRPWHTDRVSGRAVQAQLGDAPSDNEPVIGMMDTPVFAAHVVKLHNEGLAGVREPVRA